MGKLVRYCVTHTKPMLPRHLYDEEIALGEYNASSRFHVSNLDLFWHRFRSVAYGAAGGYAVPKALELSGSEFDLVGVFSYRKLVTRSAFGVESKSYLTMRLVSASDMELVDGAEVTPVGENEFLVPQPIRLPSGILGQYANVHMLEDFLDYVSMAVGMGVLSREQAVEFIKGEVLIPGGCELGVYPRGWLENILRILGELGRSFLNKYAGRIIGYNAYQVRAIGFLSERIGSFLLLQELFRRYPAGIPTTIFGYMVTVTDRGDDYTLGMVG